MSAVQRTQQHLVFTIKSELSTKLRDRYTLTDLNKASRVSRSTIYYHFEDIDDIYRHYFEKEMIPEIIKNCRTFDDLIVSGVDYILQHRVRCLNIFNLAEFLHRQNYFLDMFADAFNDHEIPFNKLDQTQKHLMSGVIYILRCWFEEKLRTDRDEIISQLHEQGQVLKRYKGKY